MAKRCDQTKEYAFISYCHRDEKQVIPIAQALASNYNIWLDVNEMVPGDEWDADKAIPAIRNENCKFVISFISDDYLISKPCGREVETAKENSKKIIPIIFEDRTPKEIVEELEKKLDTDTEFAKAHKLTLDQAKDLKGGIEYTIRLIMGSEESYMGNKKLYAVIDDEKLISKLCDALEISVVPKTNLRKWLVESTDRFDGDRNMYRLTQEMNKKEGTAAGDELRASCWCTFEHALILLVRLEYALGNKGEVMDYSNESNAVKQFAYGCDIDEEEFADSITWEKFTHLLYHTVVSGIKDMEDEDQMGYLHMDYDKGIVKIMDLFKSNGIIPSNTAPETEINFIDQLVNATVEFMRLLERDYADIINEQVFKIKSDD